MESNPLDEVSSFAAATSIVERQVKTAVPSGNAAEGVLESLRLELDTFREAWHLFKANNEEERKAAADLLSMKLDAMQRQLGSEISDLESVASKTAQKVTREALHQEVRFVHENMERISESVHARLRLMDQRVDGIDKTYSNNMATFEYQMSALSSKCSRLAEEIHQACNSQSNVAAELESVKLTVEALHAESVAATTRREGSRRASVLEAIQQQISALNVKDMSDADSLNTKLELLAEKLEDSEEQTRNELEELNLHIEAEKAARLALKQEVDLRVIEILEDKLKNLPQKEEPSGRIHNGTVLELQARLAALEREQKERQDHTLEDPSIKNIRQRILDLEGLNLQDRFIEVESQMARLIELEHERTEAAKSQHLDERVALLESAQRNSAPAPPHSARGGPPRPASAMSAGRGESVGASHILALRDELHRLRGRQVSTEKQLEEVKSLATDGTGRAMARVHQDQLAASLDAPLQELRHEQQRREDDYRRELNNLAKALSGHQRAHDLSVAKMDDVVATVSKVEERFEASLPQLLRLVSELAKRSGGGTGETQGDLADTTAETLEALMRSLFQSPDGSGLPFVTPASMHEVLQQFEKYLTGQLRQIQQDLLNLISAKTDTNTFQALVAQFQNTQRYLSSMGRSFNSMQAAQRTELSEHPAIFRQPLQARCVSCDRKVDVKGVWGGDSQPTSRPASPLLRSGARSAGRARRELPQLETSHS
eukprot:TRINITY_DN27562_c0_g1_i1.p1 TRINITY_DN27562_c0_g1~~TRINITY_DN27562_c0_g1_i1.p1  ORF type:complete len:719 (+),score=166.34 TRINITY_DN27562_c0_g1_i1:85-2241(+)